MKISQRFQMMLERPEWWSERMNKISIQNGEAKIILKISVQLSGMWCLSHSTSPLPGALSVRSCAIICPQRVNCMLHRVALSVEPRSEWTKELTCLAEGRAPNLPLVRGRSTLPWGSATIGSYWLIHWFIGRKNVNNWFDDGKGI